MAVADKNRITDEFRSAPRGVNSGVDPSTISKGYVSFAVNMTCRGGYYRPRPPFNKVELDWQGNEDAQDGLFQTAAFFKPRNGKPCLMASISGRLYRFNPYDLNPTVSGASPFVKLGGVIHSDDNNAQRRQAWMLQAEDWLILQDGQRRPIFYDGTSSRRAGDSELPVGCMMEYIKGRIGVVLVDRRSFVFGDLVYGPTGTAQYSKRDAVLKFTENQFYNEGGVFATPMTAGRINAIRNIAVLDTSTGQGPAQVFAAEASYSINLPVDRTTWKDLTFPAETVSTIGKGALAQDSTISINGDIYFRSEDGLRTFVLAVRNFSEPGNTPISGEMKRVLEADDRNLLEFGSSILFDNRLLTTCSPANSFLHGTYHRGLIALDFDIASTMSDKLPPAYDALWTGIRVLKLVEGEGRAWAFVLSSADKIELWEINRTGNFDNRTKRIESYLELGTFYDGNELLKLHGGFMSVDQLCGRTEFNVRYRPDEHQEWIDWHTWSECSEFETCSLTDCSPPRNLKAQYRQRMDFPDDPPIACVSEDNRPSNMGYTFQLRIGLTGSARIKRLRVHSYKQDEKPFAEPRCEEGPCEVVDVCDLPVFGYSSEIE